MTPSFPGKVCPPSQGTLSPKFSHHYSQTRKTSTQGDAGRGLHRTLPPSLLKASRADRLETQHLSSPPRATSLAHSDCHVANSRVVGTKWKETRRFLGDYCHSRFQGQPQFRGRWRLPPATGTRGNRFNPRLSLTLV